MNNSEEFDENTEHFNAVCNLIKEAVCNALDEGDLCEDLDARVVKHVNKRFEYMKQEGWITEGKIVFVSETEEDESH